MKAAIIYESLTGNTEKAANLIAAELRSAGHQASVHPITRVDYQALADADMVVVGSWTDGLLFVGQKPGRAGRLKQFPHLAGKRCVVFCTYAIDVGRTLQKLSNIMEDRGANVIGGMAIKRSDLEGGAQDFVDRLLDAVAV